MLSNRLENYRLKQSQRQNYVRHLIEQRIKDWTKSYFVLSYPVQRQKLREYLIHTMTYAPRDLTYNELRDGVDAWIELYVTENKLASGGWAKDY